MLSSPELRSVWLASLLMLKWHDVLRVMTHAPHDLCSMHTAGTRHGAYYLAEVLRMAISSPASPEAMRLLGMQSKANSGLLDTPEHLSAQSADGTSSCLSSPRSGRAASGRWGRARGERVCVDEQSPDSGGNPPYR